MKRDKSKDITNKTEDTNNLSKSEYKELERLINIFGKKFDLISIERNSVMGYSENRGIYLGTKEDYYKYRRLKSQKLSKKKIMDKYIPETYSNFNL